jgi:DNA-directed RNA polymerase specialized sigma24 family protein
MEREEMLRAFYRASTHHTAKFLTPSSEQFDDMVQEGVVKAWTAVADKQLDDPTTYGAVAARRHITGVMTGKQPMLGSEAEPKPRRGSAPQAKRGKSYDQHRLGTRVSESVVVNMPSRGDAYAIVDHRIDMQRATAGFTGKDRIIIAMIKADEPWTAIARRLRMTPTGVKNRWNRTLQPALALAFVRDAAPQVA